MYVSTRSENFSFLIPLTGIAKLVSAELLIAGRIFHKHQQRAHRVYGLHKNVENEKHLHKHIQLHRKEPENSDIRHWKQSN